MKILIPILLCLSLFGAWGGLVAAEASRCNITVADMWRTVTGKTPRIARRKPVAKASHPKSARPPRKPYRRVSYPPTEGSREAGAMRGDIQH